MAQAEAPEGSRMKQAANRNLLCKAIDYARRFKWGFENYIGGSDDWRCDARAFDGLDDNDDPMAFDYEPCTCAECAGASAREWSRDGKLPLSVRVALNLAVSQGQTAS